MYDNPVKAAMQLCANTQERTPNTAQDQAEEHHKGRQVKSLAQPQRACKNTKRADTSLLTAPPPAESIAPQVPCPNRVVQTWPDCPDLSDPDLPINCLIPDFIPLEKQVPRPPFTPRLKEDRHLTTDFQADNSLTFIEEQLAERRRVEEKGKEFVFAPLMVTLENMQTFIKHIEAGKQFTQPLTQDEAAALERIGQQTTALVKAEQALYKRTLRLALSLMILCEIITQRQVIAPLLQKKPALSEDLSTSYTISHLGEDKPGLLAALPLTEQNGPGEKQPLPSFEISSMLSKHLFDEANNQNLLLYPSFHPLTVVDFCRFGHLPLHPVGLITDYVMGADSQLKTPLRFAEHDLAHMRDLSTVNNPGHCPTSPAEAALCSSAKRLNWRQLLLDKVPAPVATWLSQPALQQLLFQLFHENNPQNSANIMGSCLSAFPVFLNNLVDARTTQRDAYEDIYREITTDQAVMAALWIIRLWSCWLTADCQLSPKQLQDCAKAFIDKDVPRLKQHLMFFSRYRASLRQLFAQKCTLHLQNENNGWTLGGRYGPEQKHINFFCSDDCPRTGLRNTERCELVYFQSLHSPDARLAMEQQTRARLPAGTGPEPGTPV